MNELLSFLGGHQKIEKIQFSNKNKSQSFVQCLNPDLACQVLIECHCAMLKQREVRISFASRQHMPSDKGRSGMSGGGLSIENDDNMSSHPSHTPDPVSPASQIPIVTLNSHHEPYFITPTGHSHSHSQPPSHLGGLNMNHHINMGGLAMGNLGGHTPGVGGLQLPQMQISGGMTMPGLPNMGGPSPGLPQPPLNFMTGGGGPGGGGQQQQQQTPNKNLLATQHRLPPMFSSIPGMPANSVGMMDGFGGGGGGMGGPNPPFLSNSNSNNNRLFQPTMANTNNMNNNNINNNNNMLQQLLAQQNNGPLRMMGQIGMGGGGGPPPYPLHLMNFPSV